MATAGLPIEPLEFFRELFGILRRGGVQRIVKGATVAGIAATVVIPALRTAGFFFNRALGAKALTPAERLKIGVTFGFPAGINPFLFSFLSGFAYPSSEDVVEGWLSTFGKLAFRDVPGVESDLEDALRRGAKQDFRGVLDAIATFYTEELGISDAAAFMRGIGGATKDVESLTGLQIPVGYVVDGIIWLDRALRGIFDPPPKPTRPSGPPLPLDPAFRNKLADKKLPGAIKRLTMKVLREQPGAVLFDIGKAVSQGVKDKLRKLVLRRLA